MGEGWACREQANRIVVGSCYGGVGLGVRLGPWSLVLRRGAKSGLTKLAAGALPFPGKLLLWRCAGAAPQAPPRTQAGKRQAGETGKKGQC